MLQNLQDEFRNVVDLAKTTQTDLQHLRSAKKEADINKRRNELLTSLKTMQDCMAQVDYCSSWCLFHNSATGWASFVQILSISVFVCA